MKLKDLDLIQLEQAANMLKAIAHPMRIAILSYLEDGKRLTVTEIHELLNIEQSTTSHHLGILKDKGCLFVCRLLPLSLPSLICWAILQICLQVI